MNDSVIDSMFQIKELVCFCKLYMISYFLLVCGMKCSNTTPPSMRVLTLNSYLNIDCIKSYFSVDLNL